MQFLNQWIFQKIQNQYISFFLIIDYYNKRQKKKKKDLKVRFQGKKISCAI